MEYRGVETDEGDELLEEDVPTWGEIFEEQFPYYLSLGMTYDQYWHGPVGLVRAYRKADQLQKERMSFAGWLQGVYTLNALSVVLDHAFTENASSSYFAEPIRMTPKTLQEQEQEQKAAQRQLITYLNEKAKRFNEKHREEREE